MIPQDYPNDLEGGSHFSCVDFVNDSVLASFRIELAKCRFPVFPQTFQSSTLLRHLTVKIDWDNDILD